MSLQSATLTRFLALLIHPAQVLGLHLLPVWELCPAPSRRRTCLRKFRLARHLTRSPRRIRPPTQRIRALLAAVVIPTEMHTQHRPLVTPIRCALRRHQISFLRSPMQVLMVLLPLLRQVAPQRILHRLEELIRRQPVCLLCSKCF